VRRATYEAEWAAWQAAAPPRSTLLGAQRLRWIVTPDDPEGAL